MISFSNLNLGMIILLMTSRTTFSQDMDIEHLYRRIELLRSDIRSLHTNLKEVETSMNTYFIEREVLKLNQKAINSKLENVFSEVEVIKENSDSTKNSLAQLTLNKDYDKLEEIVTSNLELHSEMKNMYKILREIEDSKDNLADKQTELDSKLEKVLTEVEGIKDISKVARNISYEVSYCTDVVKENRISLLSKLKKFLQEINDRSVADISEVARNITLEFAFCKDAARINQNALDSMLATILAGIKDLTDTSAGTRNDIYFCRESYNATENLAALVLEHYESLKEPLKKEPLISSRNDTHPKAEESSGILETGGETTCTDLSKTLSSIVKALFHINISKHEYAISNIEKCWKDLPETMLGHTYFLTPKLNQEAAAKYCKDHGGKPFIPKTEDEFLYYVAMTVEPETDEYSWYPVNDIKEEGHAVLLDGTDYEKASYKLQKWEPKWKNSNDADCVTVDIFGEGSWSRCYHYDFVLLCQGN